MVYSVAPCCSVEILLDSNKQDECNITLANSLVSGLKDAMPLDQPRYAAYPMRPYSTVHTGPKT